MKRRRREYPGILEAAQCGEVAVLIVLLVVLLYGVLA